MFLQILSISSLQVNQYAGFSWKIKCLSSAGKWLGCWYPFFFISWFSLQIVLTLPTNWSFHDVRGGESIDHVTIRWPHIPSWPCIYIYIPVAYEWCFMSFRTSRKLMTVWICWLPKVSQWSSLQWCYSVMSHSPAALSQQWTLRMHQCINILYLNNYSTLLLLILTISPK